MKLKIKLVYQAEKKGELLNKSLLLIKEKYPDIVFSFGKGLIAAVLFKDRKTGNPDGKFATKVSENV